MTKVEKPWKGLFVFSQVEKRHELHNIHAEARGKYSFKQLWKIMYNFRATFLASLTGSVKILNSSKSTATNGYKWCRISQL